MGKLIYQPKGKAKEYSPWACNLYNGCSNRCTYCYNRSGVACKLLGKDDVTLKSGFDDDMSKVVDRFTKEIAKYKEKIILDRKGLFFNFVSDPFLAETWELNYQCARVALMNGVPCVFLSKKRPHRKFVELFMGFKNLVKVGVTLTGRDKMEPGADTNAERVHTLEILHGLGIKTWASIEPVIDIMASRNCIDSAYKAGCREFKIGLNSRKKEYTPLQVEALKSLIDRTYGPTCNILWKESVLDYISKKE